MATDKLALYNIALKFIGERIITSLTEDREARRALDTVWSDGKGAVNFFLEQGHWNFAMRTQKIDSSTSVVPDFGYVYAFQIPDDYVRLNMISGSERFTWPLEDYEIEADHFFCDVDPIYIRFVSDDSDYGNNFANWPQTFTLWAGAWMGLQIAPSVKKMSDVREMKNEVRRLLVDARSKDASSEKTRYPPIGSWNSARFGRDYRRDRGRRDRLTGP